MKNRIALSLLAVIVLTVGALNVRYADNGYNWVTPQWSLADGPAPPPPPQPQDGGSGCTIVIHNGGSYCNLGT